jgi:hypothetical protein
MERHSSWYSAYIAAYGQAVTAKAEENGLEFMAKPLATEVTPE